MKTFKKSRLSIILSSFLLLVACGGGGGDGGESSGSPERPSGSPGFSFPVPGKTPVPGGGGNDQGGGSPEDGDSEGGNPEKPKPVETVPWVPVEVFVPPALPPDDSDFRCLFLSDIHARYPRSSREVVDVMDIHPNFYSSADNDLDHNRFGDFLGKIAAEWQNKEKIDCIVTLGDTSSHGGDRYLNLYMAHKDLKEKLGDKLNAPVISIFGNNDSADSDHYGPHDATNYSAVPAAAGWKYVAGTRPDGQMHSAYVSRGVPCSATATYPCIYSETPDGYFAIYLRKGLKLIGFESIMVADKASDEYGNDQVHAAAKEKQFRWFERQIWESAQTGDAVILGLHIMANSAWVSADEQRFENIIKQYKSKVIGVFTGHSHFDNTYKERFSDSYVRLNVPGLSTSHGNAAAFREVSIGKKKDKKTGARTDWAIKNSTTYTFTPATLPLAPLLPPSLPAGPVSVQAEPSLPPVKLVTLYNFYGTYCPKKSMSDPDMTMLDCFNAGEGTSSILGQYETAGNLNCKKVEGQQCVN